MTPHVIHLSSCADTGKEIIVNARSSFIYGDSDKAQLIETNYKANDVFFFDNSKVIF